MNKHEQWIKKGKKVWVVVYSIKDQAGSIVALTYGDDELDAITGTMLENPKNIIINTRTITMLDRTKQMPNGRFIGYAK